MRSCGGKTKPYEENGQHNWYFQCNVEYKHPVIIIIINRLFVCTLINKIHICIWGVKFYDLWIIRQALDMMMIHIITIETYSRSVKEKQFLIFYKHGWDHEGVIFEHTFRLLLV